MSDVKYKTELERRMEKIEQDHETILRRSWAPLVSGFIGATGIWLLFFIFVVTKA